MSLRRFLIRGGIGFVISILIITLLNIFLDSQTANIIFIVGMIIYFIGASLLGWYRSARRNQTKILPLVDDMPEAIKQTDSILSSLGFQQVCKAKHKKNETYMYWNDSQDIMVALAKGDKVGARFSTYLKDGFYVSTDYPIGTKSETKKIFRHVVKSSIEAAFDYHQQQVQRHIPDYGEPTHFESIQDMINWEDQNNIRLDVHKTNIKFSIKVLVRYIIAVIVTHIVWYSIMVAIQFSFNYFGYTQLPINFGLLSNIIYIITLVICGAWAYRPMYKPETVEDRKKKEFA